MKTFGAVHTVEFTSAGTAALVNLVFGRIPDYVELYVDVKGTPKADIWFRKQVLWTTVASASVGSASPKGATEGLIGVQNEDSYIARGNTGTLTYNATGGPKPYYGGDVADGTATYTADDGTVIANGVKTSDGITVPAALQVNSAYNILVAYFNER